MDSTSKNFNIEKISKQFSLKLAEKLEKKEVSADQAKDLLIEFFNLARKNDFERIENFLKSF